MCPNISRHTNPIQNYKMIILLKTSNSRTITFCPCSNAKLVIIPHSQGSINRTVSLLYLQQCQTALETTFNNTTFCSAVTPCPLSLTY